MVQDECVKDADYILESNVLSNNHENFNTILSQWKEEFSKAISLRKTKLKQTFITDYYEKLLYIKEIRSVQNSEYKNIRLQNYFIKISDTFSNVFGHDFEVTQ